MVSRYPHIGPYMSSDGVKGLAREVCLVGLSATGDGTAQDYTLWDSMNADGADHGLRAR